MVMAACGSSDDGDDGAADVDSGQTDEDQQALETEREAGEATGDDEREVDTGPVRGGKVVYGIEADSANPWAHYAVSCAISCLLIYRAVTDPLFLTDENGEIQPYMVDSFEPNEDFTQWTFTIKEGISFHDGTPLDAEAVKYNIDTCRFSSLTGPAFLRDP
ncbi:MAG: ABC transporter substrate-binding protein, partial [Actinomycetota bacterium]